MHILSQAHYFAGCFKREHPEPKRSWSNQDSESPNATKTVIQNKGKNMFQYGRLIQKGLTTVEIMVVVATIGILLSISASYAGRATVQAELTVAGEQVLDALRIARNLSRSSESSLTLSLSRQTDDSSYRISIAPPEGQKTGPNLIDVPEIDLPDHVVVISENMTFVFDHRGLVEPTGSIDLSVGDAADDTRTIFFAN